MLPVILIEKASTYVQKGAILISQSDKTWHLNGLLHCLSTCIEITGNKSGEPGLVDRVLALHAGSRGFDSHRGHMSERFFRSNRPGYPHPVSSELEISGIRVAVGDCSVTERRRWRPPYQTGKTVHVHANTTNTTRTDARRRVCAAMVPYR